MLSFKLMTAFATPNCHHYLQILCI